MAEHWDNSRDTGDLELGSFDVPRAYLMVATTDRAKNIFLLAGLNMHWDEPLDRRFVHPQTNQEFFVGSDGNIRNLLVDIMTDAFLYRFALRRMKRFC